MVGWAGWAFAHPNILADITEFQVLPTQFSAPSRVPVTQLSPEILTQGENRKKHPNFLEANFEKF